MSLVHILPNLLTFCQKLLKLAGQHFACISICFYFQPSFSCFLLGHILHQSSACHHLLACHHLSAGHHLSCVVMFILWHTHIISETVIYLLAIIHQLSACLSETTLKPWVNVGSSSSLDDLKLEVQTSSWKLLQASRLCSLRPLDAQAVKIQSQSS